MIRAATVIVVKVALADASIPAQDARRSAQRMQKVTKRVTALRNDV